MPLESGTHRANGVDLHYGRTGGSKPPLLLLHGLTANGACWTPLARALQDRFDVIMPDARGHGHSSAPLHGYRYEDHAMDVAALVENLSLEKPIVLGHSMGGMTAAVVASRMPEILSGVVLVDPTFISAQWQREVRDSDVADQHRRILASDKASIAAEIRSRHPHRSAEIAELLAAARLQTRMSAFDVLTPPNPDYFELVRAIPVPVVLIIAERGVVSFETARDLQSANPRVQIEYIENAGHGIPYDRPERLEAAVRSFACKVHF